MGNLVQLRRSEDNAEEIAQLWDECARLRQQQRKPARLRNSILRQFAEGDARVVSGPRKGKPLTRIGRERRLRQMLDAHAECCRLVHREDFLHRRIARLAADS